MVENNSWIECATTEAFHVSKKLIKVSCEALYFLFFFSDNYLTTGLERERERERERESVQELLYHYIIPLQRNTIYSVMSKICLFKHANLPNIHDLKVAPTDIPLELNEKPSFASENEFEKGSKLI